MIEDNNQKPCFVQTSQGFSVSYKNHFLYSKYNPSKVIVQTIEKLQVLPGTVFLCFSPVLGYGLTELLQKLQKDCLVFLIEADSELFVLARTQITFSSYKDKVSFISCDELANFPVKLYEMARTGKYKRVVRLDFSAGTQFFSNFYDNFTSACTNSIMTFWKNRLTLTKFGRHYSYNFFRNLKNLPNSVPITNYIHKIENPILLLGAGQSLDSLFLQKIDFSQYFIICVDTALQPLLKRNILPDAVFIEEAQSIILKAFIGIPHNKKIHYFAGLSSVPYLCEKTGLENISFFTTKYDDTSFIKKYLNLSIMPPENPPFGSVGLTSFYYALKFRKTNDVPVFFAGLDFSYSAGKTHAKGTLAHIQNLHQRVVREVAGVDVVGLAALHQVQGHGGEHGGRAALQEHDLVALRHAHHVPQVRDGLLEDLQVHFRSVTHLHDGHARTAVAEQVLLYLFEHFSRKHGRAGREIVDAIHRNKPPQQIPPKVQDNSPNSSFQRCICSILP